MKKSVVISIIVAVIAILIIGVVMTGKLSRQNDLAPQTKKAQTQTEDKAQKPVDTNAKKQEDVKVSSLMFDIKQQNLAAETKFALKAMIDPKGMKISASQLDITFDPKMLKLESIDPSEGFSLVLANSKIDNEKGMASVVLGVPLGKPSMDSVAHVATFNFQTLSTVGQTKVTFTNESGAAADGASNNVISSLEPATINIQ